MDKNVSTNSGRRWLMALKIIFWAVMAIVLFVVGSVIATMIVLTPQRLTPITEQLVNRMLNADVSIGSVNLSARATFPFLDLDIDSVVVASRDIRALPAATRDTLPANADTVFSVGHLHGGINMLKLFKGEVELRNLLITRPKVNLLVVNEQLNNFNIFLPDTLPPDTVRHKVPDIRLNRFQLVDPQPIRYTDLNQDTYLVAAISTADLDNCDISTSNPLYNVNFESTVGSPLLEIIGQTTIPVALNGIVEWKHQQPFNITLRDFNYRISALSGMVNLSVNFLNQLTLERFDFTLNQVAASQLLDILPVQRKKAWLIPLDLKTNACFSASGALTTPYVAGSPYLPKADITVDLPDCSASWSDIRLHHLQLHGRLSMRGTTFNDAIVDIDRLLVETPSTTMQVNGAVSAILGDPHFKGHIKGDVILDKLPKSITRNMKGKLKGHISADTDLDCRTSMFSRLDFHKIQLKGDLEGDNIYYLADDTLSLYSAHKVKVDLGTNQKLAQADGVRHDSLLSGRVVVDSAYILVSGLDIKIKDIKLGVGAQSKNVSTDTTAIIPMGGPLHIGGFELFSMSDSAGVRIRGLDGKIGMRRYRNNANLPLFDLDVGINGISAGSTTTRFVISDSRLVVTANKLADHQLPVSMHEVRRLTDSISRQHPDIALDSVYSLALEIRNRHRRHQHRVHKAFTADDSEIIYWGTSNAFARLLLDWHLEGSIKSGASHLYSPAFPLRNVAENLNITFNNDSVSLSNVAYKAGSSDFLISGKISNLKRAFTSKNYRQPLKINFDLRSQMIDVNEISNALFTGASNRHKKKHRSLEHSLSFTADTFAPLSHADTVAPWLVPTNIDAELRISANRVVYSDIALKGVTGTVLMCDGAVNLHDLSASSQIGSVDISALYSAVNARDIDFGFGMKVNRFNIKEFLHLVPAVDSLMPMMRNLSGIIDASVAATARIDKHMDIIMPSLKAAINITGDSIVIVDPPTIKGIAKWLLFKGKSENMIKHISASMLVDDDRLQVYPFIFDFDGYRLGIQGYNDIDLQLDYHIAVLHSPLPFKFGINVSGHPGDLKVRLGGAHFDEKESLERSWVVDTARINLIKQFEGVFRRGVKRSRFATLNVSERPMSKKIDIATDTLSCADSLYFKKEGLLPK